MSSAMAFAQAQDYIDAQVSAADAAGAGGDARLRVLADLHRRHLWHQLTLATLELVRDPAALAGGNVVQVRGGREGGARAAATVAAAAETAAAFASAAAAAAAVAAAGAGEPETSGLRRA
jgi:hypothetical protein